MKELRIKILTSGASKEEEIDIIEKLVAAFDGKDLYLTEFFTTELLGWVARQIKDDFPCNIYSYAIEKYEKKINLLQLDALASKGDNRHPEYKVEEYERRWKAVMSRVEALETDKATLLREITGTLSIRWKSTKEGEIV